MFLIRRPSAREVEAFIAASANLPLSYQPVGIANGTPAGYTLDEASGVIGNGEAAFAAARRALFAWHQFALDWVELCPRAAPAVPGTVVAVLVRHLGFWSLNGCRVVYGIDGDAQRAGFAYGTLTNHAEMGEETFAVALCPRTGDVTYAIRAVSRPRAFLARCGYPFTRLLQARFRRDSIAAMRRAVAGSSCSRQR